MVATMMLSGITQASGEPHCTFFFSRQSKRPTEPMKKKSLLRLNRRADPVKSLLAHQPYLHRIFGPPLRATPDVSAWLPSETHKLHCSANYLPPLGASDVSTRLPLTCSSARCLHRIPLVMIPPLRAKSDASICSHSKTKQSTCIALLQLDLASPEGYWSDTPRRGTS